MKFHVRLVIRICLLCLASTNMLHADALSLMVNDLNNPSLSVRRTAIGELLKIAYNTIPVRAPAGSSFSALQDPSVHAAVLRATSDPDSAVRIAALETYALTYKLAADVEDKIIAEIRSPEATDLHQPSDKPALVEMLMIGGSPSPEATEFLTTLLDDPAWAPLVANRISTDTCPLSGAALEKLVQRISQERDPATRATYASAIGAYRKQAQQYAPELRILVDNERDNTSKRQLQRALANIQ